MSKAIQSFAAHFDAMQRACADVPLLTARSAFCIAPKQNPPGQARRVVFQPP
jgi:hypothetical protein